jgi:hypothetical protein
MSRPPTGPGRPTPSTRDLRPVAAIEMFYRVYEPDRGRDLDGGTGLPAPELVRADGSTSKDSAAPRSTTPTAPSPPRRSRRPPGAPRATRPAATGRPNPAYVPVRWERFFNIDYSQRAVIQDCTPLGRSQRIGDAAGARRLLQQSRQRLHLHPPLPQVRKGAQIQARLPTTPQTYAGQRRMGSGQLRFWSLCSGESRVTLRTPDARSRAPPDADVQAMSEG